MANKFVTVLSLLMAASSTYAAGIQGGTASSFTAHPYYVSITDLGGEHICGGALISKDLVLSSSSCFLNYGANRLLVRLGDGSLVPLADSTVDMGVRLYVENDIGLAKLATPVTESSTVGVIKVASSNTASGTRGVVVALDAWDRLAEAPVKIISAAQCSSSEYFYKSGQVTSSEVCALPKSKSICNMSSGSPLVANNELVGVASAYYGCAKPGRPAVYMNVAALNSWIQSASQKL